MIMRKSWYTKKYHEMITEDTKRTCLYGLPYHLLLKCFLLSSKHTLLISGGVKFVPNISNET